MQRFGSTSEGFTEFVQAAAASEYSSTAQMLLQHKEDDVFLEIPVSR